MDRVSKDTERRERLNLEWVLEVVLLVIVTPAIFYGLASLSGLPIA